MAKGRRDPYPVPIVRPSRPPKPAVLAGRYELFDVIASGGMATVHFARLHGKVGFARTVAVKRLHPQFAREADFRAMFVDEARVAARVVHPNVAQTLDVVEDGDELFIVMEYIHGLPLSHLMKLAATDGGIPVSVAAHIMGGVLSGLHAAHEAQDETGQPLKVVHRDVSPQNILVGSDGVARLIDFGVAKAVSQIHTTREGQLRGKLAYMAPEQIRQGVIDRQTDIFSASIVLWQCLANRRLFEASNDGELIYQLLEAPVSPPSLHRADVPTALDTLTLRGLERDRSARYQTAREMVLEIEKAAPVISQNAVSEWVQRVAAEPLQERDAVLREVGRSTSQPIVASVVEGTETVTVPLGASAVSAAMSSSDRGTLTDSQVSVDARWARPKRSLRLPVAAAAGLVGLVSVGWVALSAGTAAEVADLERSGRHSDTLLRWGASHAQPVPAEPEAGDASNTPGEPIALDALPEAAEAPKKRPVYWRPAPKPKAPAKPKPASLYKRE